MSREPDYSEFEKGERQALLQVRSFIIKHGTKEVDAFCAQRLHDIMMDRRHAGRATPKLGPSIGTNPPC